ncbi:MAG TPA: hypothetical protein VFV05_09185 [Methylomirabilota bacterium]|nr:hypothetical protein [Methylomirabilota bacterium]
MDRNPWKIATIGLALVGTTALGTGLTTAWMMRAPAQAVAQEAPAVTAQAPTVRHAAATARPATFAAARPATPPRVTPVSTAAAPVDCATGGERAMRIAKPGLVGALLGAGLGAAGGAIADGGKAAGKGALIGGLAGGALGAGYGAYKTKNECGTILGDAFGGSTPAYSANARQATFGPAQGITVYNAR